MNDGVRALVVFSGGLDSILVVKILEEQHIKVSAICFESNFYDAQTAKKSAKELGIDLKIINISRKILALTKDPPNGFGKNMNPCVDCHALMFCLAGEEKKKNKFDILATGEVLGQRPFSQNKDALGRVQKLAKVDILRPLSARLLPKTSYEREALIDREKLGEIHGRTRSAQTEMARKYNIKYFPSPAGGCLLTDPSFSSRLRLMLDNWENCQIRDVELLKYARVFWFKDLKDSHVLVLVGRHQNDNSNLERLAQDGDIVLQLKDINGPSTLIRGLKSGNLDDIEVDIPKDKPTISNRSYSVQQILEKSAIITAYYVPKIRGKKAIVKVKFKV